MRIKVQCHGVEYKPGKCPFTGAGDQVFDCEHPDAGTVRCAYESTQMFHVDPPINCPLRRRPAALIAEAAIP